ncbi:MAG: transposase [Eubacteriales bacterium]
MFAWLPLMTIKGLVNAVRKHFQGASWQRCQTHFFQEHTGSYA